MKLKIVTPIVVDKAECERRTKGYKPALRKNTKIKVVSIKQGPTYLDYYFEHLESEYGVLLEGEKAEKEGYDAIIPDCVFDPATKALKGKLDIPVVAPLETAIHIAVTLGKKFSVLGLDDNMSKILEDRVKEYGLGDKLASVRSMGITYQELIGGHSEQIILKKVIKSGRLAVEEDEADVIVLGCTCTFGREIMQKKLGVPVIEPGVLAAKLAEVFLDINLKQSKKAYPASTKKYEKRFPLRLDKT